MKYRIVLNSIFSILLEGKNNHFFQKLVAVENKAIFLTYFFVNMDLTTI